MKKGPLAEALVVACLREHGWPYAERRVQGGVNDRGDVAGIPGLVVEVKNHEAMKLAAWVDEAVREARPMDRRDETYWDDAIGNVLCEADVAVCWHKRRGKGDPLDWYVTMTGRDFLALLAEYTRED